MNLRKYAAPMLLLAALSACEKKEAAQPPSPATTPASESVQKMQPDPDAINQPLPAEAVKVALAFDGPAKLSEDGKTFEIPVRIDNNGTAALYGKGTYPVRLGVQLVNQDGDVKGAGAIRDFHRMALPLIKPSTSTTVAARVPVDPRLDQKYIRIDLVQEKVSWFEKLGNSPIMKGPFSVCGPNICGEDGLPIAR